MLQKSLLGALGLLACAPLLAQSVLGKTEEVRGLVTVSQGSRLATAAVGSPVIDGSRYVTSTGSSVTLKLDNGCVLRMKSSQSLLIDGQKSCDELIALLNTSSDALVAALPAGGIHPAIGAGIVAGLGIAALSNGGSTKAGGSTPGGLNPGGGGSIPGGGGSIPGGGGNLPISIE